MSRLEEVKQFHDAPGETAEDVSAGIDPKKRRKKIKANIEKLRNHLDEIEQAGFLEEVTEAQMKSILKTVKEAVPFLFGGSKIKTGITIRVPDPEGQFKPVSGGPEGTEKLPPHITLCWVGDCTEKELKSVIGATEEAARMADPFVVEARDYGEFKNKEGKVIAHLIPRSHGVLLEALHRILVTKLREHGVKVDHHEGPFKPHITLDYMDSRGFEGDLPVVEWEVTELEVWHDDGQTVVPLGGERPIREQHNRFRVVHWGEGFWIFDSLKDEFLRRFDDQKKAFEALEEMEDNPADPSGMTPISEQGSFVPPKEVQAEAAKGLMLRREFGRGGTDVGIARGRDLSNGRPLTADTINRMVAFFARHEENKDTPPEEGNGKIAWLLWGGDPGREWAERIQSQFQEGTIREQDEVYTEDDWEGDKARFTVEELAAAVPNAVLKWAQEQAELEDRDLIKEDLKLPFREPDGTINLNGVRAALAAIGGARGGVDLPAEVQADAQEELETILQQGNVALSEASPLRETLTAQGWREEWINAYLRTK